MNNPTDRARPDIPEGPPPLFWHCKKCDWVGTAAHMSEDYCCPKCGEFKEVRIMIFLPADVFSKEAV